MKLKKNIKGMTAIDLVYFAFLVIVSLVVFNSYDTANANLSMTTVAKAARNNVSLNTYGGFQTISSGPTIIAAVVILGIVAFLMYRH
jgi:hypothetical protein